MINIKAIFIKQLTSLIKAPSMIVQGILFLIIAGAFIFFFPYEEDVECLSCIPAYICAACEYIAYNRFELPIPSGTAIFAIIFVGLALVGSASGQVAEDKSTTNLRFMAMADVRPWQYLIGTFCAMVIVMSFMLVFYALLGGYFGVDMLRFMSIGVFGGMVSILLGIAIGLSKAPLLATPISLILGLGPTFAAGNEAAANLLRFTFIQQVNIAFADLNADLTSNFMIVAINGVVILLVFFIAHRKNRFNL